MFVFINVNDCIQGKNEIYWKEIDNHKTFEQDWKNARVTPIYKDDDDINDENNYRPNFCHRSYCKDDRISCELSNYWFFGRA